MINRTCENCVHGRLNDYDTCYWCKHNAVVNPNERKNNPKYEEYFAPKEELVRRDEKEQMIDKIKKFYHTARNEKFSNSMKFLELLVYLKED